MMAPDLHPVSLCSTKTGLMIQLYFPKRNTSVWIFDRRNTAIGIDRDVWLLFQDAKVHVFSLVGNPEFLKEDDDFPWIRSRCVGV